MSRAKANHRPVGDGGRVPGEELAAPPAAPEPNAEVPLVTELALPDGDGSEGLMPPGTSEVALPKPAPRREGLFGMGGKFGLALRTGLVARIAGSEFKALGGARELV